MSAVILLIVHSGTFVGGHANARLAAWFSSLGSSIPTKPASHAGIRASG